ncbi:hypothetical protein QMK17_18340 [Rhodococcus sp. G-MC3]|uniref:hypothetical protein n=1 Tax=Rhodococcus sp. G-MC3 TaxID=3046209 RepID=UPI0024B9D188|nr:hypothetical protein [Rhodococcus sp. G-MC3]MDJ0395290.1 hypothetical protein [Rhodococcus sp. G-MC3]
MLIRPAENCAAYNPADALPDVGLHVDDERSIAAVSRPSRANPSLHVASLHRTVLYVHGDGTASLGGTDDQCAAEFTDFVNGDVDSGLEPGELIAMTLRCLLVEVAQSIGTDPALLAAASTFPARWTAQQVSDLRTAMNRYGLAHVALVSETEALTVWSESTQATWAGSDTGIAAARGAASIASHYPVDAITEAFAIARPERAVSRTPVLAAVAFAALLTLGAGVASLMLRDNTAPAIPQIESATIADPTTAGAVPTNAIPFPTVVPIIEPLAPVPAEATTESAPTTTAQARARDEPTTELPQTRPAAERSEQPDRTVEVPVEEDPVEEDPVDPQPTKPSTQPPVDEGSGPSTLPEPTDPATASPAVSPAAKETPAAG